MNPYDATLFTAPDCLPCCAPAPADCSCALLIPPFGSPYADYATAETAIADQTDNCIGYIAPAAGDTIDSFTADNATADTVILTGEVSDAGDDAALTMYCSVSLKAGSTLTVAFDVTSTDTDPETDAENSVIFQLFNCDGTGLDTQTDSSTDNPFTGTFTYSVVSDGEYIVLVNAQGRPLNSGGQTVLAEWTISSDDTLWVNPVIALWDDSGTTRNLWACPKLLLPPLTESTGDWYADCAAADAVLTDALQVSNCVGYSDDFVAASFTATDGGTSLSFATTYSPAASFGTGTFWGSINAVAGETLSFAATTDGGSPLIGVSIYDDEGVLVETSGGAVATPFVSATLPYTGRYTVSLFYGVPPPGDPFTSGTATITSSGTMSVNEIAAAWDNGLTCPSYLNCGDSC